MRQRHWHTVISVIVYNHWWSIYTNPETCLDTPFPYDKFDELVSLIEELEESNTGGNEYLVLDTANHITETMQYCQEQCNNIVDIISEDFYSYSRHQNDTVILIHNSTRFRKKILLIFL